MYLRVDDFVDINALNASSQTALPADSSDDAPLFSSSDPTSYVSPSVSRADSLLGLKLSSVSRFNAYLTHMLLTRLLPCETETSSGACR